MTPAQKLIAHEVISYTKSVVRLAGYFVGMWGSDLVPSPAGNWFWNAFFILVLAEVLGIIEEMVVD